MYLEPGWCQLCYVMICSWLWTKFTKGKPLYRVSIQSFVMKVVAGAVGCKPSRCCFWFYFTNSLCFMWAPRCASLQPFLAWKFWNTLFSQNNFQCNFLIDPFKSCLFLYSMNFTKLHKMALTQWRNDAAADSPRTWGEVISLRSILDSVTKPMTPASLAPTLPVLLFFESTDASERLWYEKLKRRSALAGDI